MGVNVEGGGGIFPTLCIEFCLVILTMEDLISARHFYIETAPQTVYCLRKQRCAS